MKQGITLFGKLSFANKKNLEEIQDVNLRKFDLHPPQPEKVSESLGGGTVSTCFFFLLFSSDVIWMGNKEVKLRELGWFYDLTKWFGLLRVLLEPG